MTGGTDGYDQRNQYAPCEVARRVGKAITWRRCWPLRVMVRMVNRKVGVELSETGRDTDPMFCCDFLIPERPVCAIHTKQQQQQQQQLLTSWRFVGLSPVGHSDRQECR